MATGERIIKTLMSLGDLLKEASLFGRTEGLSAASGNAWGVLSTSGGPCFDSVSRKRVACPVRFLLSIPVPSDWLLHPPFFQNVVPAEQCIHTPPTSSWLQGQHLGSTPNLPNQNLHFSKISKCSCALWRWRLLWSVSTFYFSVKNIQNPEAWKSWCSSWCWYSWLSPFIPNLLFFRHGYQHISGPWISIMSHSPQKF